MQVTFRPILVWPFAETRPRRTAYAFKATWSSTLSLLEREVRALNGIDIVIGGAFSERDIRLDGMLRADAQTPRHPGIELSFTARFVRGAEKRLVYATDAYSFWQHNVRAIALGLEALRAVDRYGITRAGEQYAGFMALPDPDARRSAERGAELVKQHGGVTEALMHTHPDRGGDVADFTAVQAFRKKSGG